MVPDIATAKQICEINDDEAGVLQAIQRPIVLLRTRRTRASISEAIAEDVAPGNKYLGIFLPYTPLHHLLLRKASSRRW